MLLLQVKSKELDILLKEPLATQQAEGMSFRRRGGGEKERFYKFGRSRRKITKHDIANKLRMVMN